LEETRQKKIAGFAINAYFLGAIAAKFILLILAATMNTWPDWFRIGLIIISVLSFLTVRMTNIILITMLYVSTNSNILGKFPNELPYWVRLISVILVASAAISWIIFGKYYKPEPNPNLDKNSLEALMSDPRYNKGYFDQYVKTAEDK
jgi:hypothetical protein